jgi:hypothetical protein
MKKILLAVTALAVLAMADLCLASTDIILSGGYTYSFMGEVNDQLDKVANDFNVDFNPHHHGMYGALEAMLMINDNVGLGPKVEALTCMPGKLKGSTPLGDSWAKYTGSLVPVLMGINILLPLGRTWAVLGGYVGYGFAFLHIEDSNDNTWDYDGGAFVAEIKGGLRFSLKENVFLALELGYRHARVNEMNLTESEFPYDKGDPLYIYGKNVEYEFSGIFAGVSVIFRL